MLYRARNVKFLALIRKSNQHSVTQHSRILQYPDRDSTRGGRPTPELLTQLCKATADTLRLHILRLLRNDSLSVLEMTRILDIRQPALSHHLKILAQAGLVSTRREGNLIFYRRGLLNADDPFQNFKSSLFDTLDQLPLEPRLSARLQEVKLEREQQSLDFFNKFADKFCQDEDLVADSRQYASSLTDMLRELMLDDKSTALEIGPGEGKLLPLLAREYRHIVAVDREAGMLEKARTAAAEKGLDNIEFIHGDTTTAVRKKLKANLVVISMVLHHVEKPEKVFSDLDRLLEEDGVVLVVELCRHNQEWLRDTRGDLWLGFEPEELTQWAQEAGFISGQSLYLGLRNGFQVQMRLFHKTG